MRAFVLLTALVMWVCGSGCANYERVTDALADLLDGGPGGHSGEPAACSEPSATELCNTFDGDAIADPWAIVDPRQDCEFDLSTNAGFLGVRCPTGNDLFGRRNLDGPRILTLVSGDFCIETKVAATPDAFSQGGGLFIWADADNFLRLDRMSRGEDPAQQILFIGTIDGRWTMDTGNTSNPGDVLWLDENINPTYMRVSRDQDLFTGYYSSDGQTWVEVARIEMHVPEEIRAGISVTNDYTDPWFRADFDYVCLRQ